MTAAATLLRAGLLDGVRVLLASGEPPSRFGEAVIARCAELAAFLASPAGDYHSGSHFRMGEA